VHFTVYISVSSHSETPTKDKPFCRILGVPFNCKINGPVLLPNPTLSILSLVTYLSSPIQTLPMCSKWYVSESRIAFKNAFSRQERLRCGIRMLLLRRYGSVKKACIGGAKGRNNSIDKESHGHADKGVEGLVTGFAGGQLEPRHPRK
jgi:hypothetical protein